MLAIAMATVVALNRIVSPAVATASTTACRGS